MIIPQKANSCNRAEYKKALKQFGLFQGLSAYSTSLALGGAGGGASIGAGAGGAADTTASGSAAGASPSGGNRWLFL